MQTELFTYFKRNWFKISLAAIFIFVAFKKDLSFQINLNSPIQPEQIEQETPAPARRAKEERKEETLTENQEKPAETPPTKGVDRFKFSLWEDGKKGTPTAYEALKTVDDHIVTAYLKRFVHVAESEQKKYGVPASVILGNALLMSKAGEREMARQGNNHFALPCTEDWQGETGRHEGQCFRHYDIAWTSFRDHSLYLTTGETARRLQGLSSDADYEAWAKALEKATFSSEKDYAKQLIRVIKDYDLQELGQ